MQPLAQTRFYCAQAPSLDLFEWDNKGICVDATRRATYQNLIFVAHCWDDRVKYFPYSLKDRYTKSDNTEFYELLKADGDFKNSRYQQLSEIYSLKHEL